MNDFPAILIVGCGNMGGAMLRGWLAAGRNPDSFTILDPALEHAPEGVTLLRAPPQSKFDAILLGVKPQILGQVAPSLEALAGPETALLSILAGVELATLTGHFPRAGAIVRLMPNLSAALGKSPVALAAEGLDRAGQARIAALLAPLGQTEWLAESLFDLVTALAGSGPAFVYRFIDALATGATALGMDRAQAERLALATVEGAAALAVQSGESPGELARRVASPGGTTEAGLKALDANDALGRLVEGTLRAARDRGAEMAAQARAAAIPGSQEA